MRRPLTPNEQLAQILGEFGRSLSRVSELMLGSHSDADWVGKSVSMSGVPDGKMTAEQYGESLPVDEFGHLKGLWPSGKQGKRPVQTSADVNLQLAEEEQRDGQRVENARRSFEDRGKRESKPSALPAAEAESSPKMRRAILIALAQMDKRSMTPEQIGIYSGKAYKGGAFIRALGDLKAEDKVVGLIGGKLLQITDAGFEELGDWARLPEGMALFEHWCSKLGEMTELILRCLLANEEALTPEQIGERIERAHKGGAFIRALGTLRKMELIAPWMTRGTYQLSAELRRAVAPSVRVFNTATGEHHRVDARRGHTQ